MGSADLVILTLFLLTMVYIVNRAIASVDKRTKVDFVKKLEGKTAPDPKTLDPTAKEFKPKEEPFDKQLERMKFGERSLKDILDVSFKFKKRYKYSLKDHAADEQPRSLTLILENKSKDVDVYVDWDGCSITDYDNAARRIVRLMPGKSPILLDSQPPKFQAPSLVAPGDKLTTFLTAEDLLQMDPEKKIMEPKVPILDFKSIRDKSKNKEVPKPTREALEKRLTAFDERRQQFVFFLRLSLRLVELNRPDARDYPYYLWCKFTVTNMPWFDQLPWNPRK